MYLWKLSRNSVGYGEASEVLIAAGTEIAARHAAAKEFRGSGYEVDFLDCEAVSIGEANSDIEEGTLVMLDRASE